MERRVFMLMINVFFLSLSLGIAQKATAQVKRKNLPPKASPRPVPSIPARISWTPAIEAFTNLSKEDFDSIGLSTLTPSQYSAFVAWYFKYGRISCPTFYDGHDKVRVNVSVSADDAIRDEILSSLLDRLRVPGDLTITDTVQDADAVISIVALRGKSKGGQPLDVYSAALNSYQPCKENYSTLAPSIYVDFLGPLELDTAGDAQELANELYTSKDAEVLNQLRKQRDLVQNAIKSSKKPGL
ncbi:MAG TPA: hypothetical protein VJN21_08535 [Candidatus Acidoferrales bacterium]|nr:hypothetical protein [Candidatus Acidoferrales bacterium]